MRVASSVIFFIENISFMDNVFHFHIIHYPAEFFSNEIEEKIPE